MPRCADTSGEATQRAGSPTVAGARGVEAWPQLPVPPARLGGHALLREDGPQPPMLGLPPLVHPSTCLTGGRRAGRAEA